VPQPIHDLDLFGQDVLAFPRKITLRAVSLT
jgi:Tfp pilus assembly protein PilO